MRDVTVPGDKSISHRALMLAALADGESRISGLLDSADTRATAEVLRRLGVDIPSPPGELRVIGAGVGGLRAPDAVLDCANSGTTARLMMGVAAAHPFTSTFDGDASLRGRPMRRVTEPLTRMGARIRELGEPDRLPVELQGGALQAIEWHSEKSSAQVKSALLLAALNARVPAAVTEPLHSRDHTERMLDALGASIRTVVQEGVMRIELDPVERLNAFDLTVPGDFSSAAFFLALGLLGGTPVRIPDVGVNATRTGFLDVVRRMQGQVHVQDRRTSCNEPLATLLAEPSALHATHVDAPEIPHLIDEVPILAVMAARAEGETVIQGAAELRVKETDRLHALAQNLAAVGVSVEESSDGLAIRGTSAPLRGRVTTFGDHRIAMAFGVLASLPGNEITMDDPECVAVSFPGFWKQLSEFSA